MELAEIVRTQAELAEVLTAGFEQRCAGNYYQNYLDGLPFYEIVFKSC